MKQEHRSIEQRLGPESDLVFPGVPELSPFGPRWGKLEVPGFEELSGTKPEQGGQSHQHDEDKIEVAGHRPAALVAAAHDVWTCWARWVKIERLASPQLKSKSRIDR